MQGKGFQASYTTHESKCGGVMRGERGVVMSPNYPNNYDSNDDCGWLLEVDQNHVVQLMFEVSRLYILFRKYVITFTNWSKTMRKKNSTKSPRIPPI